MPLLADASGFPAALVEDPLRRTGHRPAHLLSIDVDVTVRAERRLLVGFRAPWPRRELPRG